MWRWKETVEERIEYISRVTWNVIRSFTHQNNADIYAIQWTKYNLIVWIKFEEKSTKIKKIQYDKKGTGFAAA